MMYTKYDRRGMDKKGKVISIRLNSEEEKLFSAFAEFEGVNISTLVKEIMFDALEDFQNARIANDILSSVVDGAEFNLQELMERLDSENIDES